MFVGVWCVFVVGCARAFGTEEEEGLEEERRRRNKGCKLPFDASQKPRKGPEGTRSRTFALKGPERKASRSAFRGSATEEKRGRRRRK